MRFLYGDTTAFPLAENFLETLTGVVDTCVALLKIDEELDDLSGQERDVKVAAEDAQHRIALIQRSLERTVESASDVAAEVIDEARAALTRAAEKVAQHRDDLQRELRLSRARLRGGIATALEEFFRTRKLPDMCWSLDWRAATHGRPAHAVATGRTLFGLEVKLDLDTAGFEAPRRVRDLAGEMSLRLPRPAGWLRRGGTSRVRLDGLLITEVECSPARETLLLRRGTRAGAPGFAVTVRADGQSLPTIQRLGSTEAVVVDGNDAAAVLLLGRKVAAWLGGMETRKLRLASATYIDAPANDVRRPARLAEAVLVSIAELTSEIRQRSRLAGEYVLKREIRAGVREELYLRREDLEGKLAPLGEERQSYFERLGLLDSRVVYLDAMSPTPLDWLVTAKA
jgi:hypothetical protein